MLMLYDKYLPIYTYTYRHILIYATVQNVGNISCHGEVFCFPFCHLIVYLIKFSESKIR